MKLRMIVLALTITLLSCSSSAPQPPQAACQLRPESPLPPPLPKCKDPSLVGMINENRGATGSKDCYHVKQEGGKFTFYWLMRGPFVTPKEKVEAGFPRFVSSLEAWYAKLAPKPKSMKCTDLTVLPQKEIDEHGFGASSVCEFRY